ncbi:DUF4132 domain-containing protein [Puteibacter caeruleilacunae]|nr:DUF4132 domain-containing protein [Puteibacter caeruleilacunae]
MSTTKQALSEKQIKNHPLELINSLRRFNSNTSNLLRVFNSKDRLSKSNAYLGLLLLNKIAEYSDRTEYHHWGRSYVEQNTSRYNALQRIATGKDFWNDKRFPLLTYLFGERMAEFVKQAWDKLPCFMYQAGYSRRSFRSKQLHEINFTRQLNFIIELIYESNYELSLEEYAIHSNTVVTTNHCFVLAAAIDAGDKTITELCLDTIYGRHDIAKPSRTIIKAMLLSENQECWIAVEKLLLSAQRQEGLRQTILECLDETSLGALKHMIKVILDNKLTRFSSVVRAIDVWAGFGWESEKEATVKRLLELADQFLSDPSSIEAAVESDDNAVVYMALWAQGVFDVKECPPLLDKVLQGNQEKISLALFFISQVGISSFSIKYGYSYLEHDDRVVACQAIDLVNEGNFINLLNRNHKHELFRILEGRLENFPKKTTKSKPRIFSWLTFKYGKELVLDLMINLIDLDKVKDMDLITPYFDSLALMHREKVTRLILPDYYGYYNDTKPISLVGLSKKKRDFAFSILKDRSETIRSTAIKALADANISYEEIQVFEDLLTRKSADFRKSVLELITKQGQNQVKKSAERLLEAKNAEQRLAGLDLLLWLKKNGAGAGRWLNKKVDEFADRPSITSKEELILSGLREESSKVQDYSSDNGYGLFTPEKVFCFMAFDRTREGVYNDATSSNKYGLTCSEDHINSCISKLGKLILENQEYEYKHEGWDNNISTSLLGNEFAPLKRDTAGMTTEEKFCNYPLHELWQEWYEKSGLDTRDIFLLNLNLDALPSEYESRNTFDFLNTSRKYFFKPVVPKIGEYTWQNPIFRILTNLEERYPYEEAIDFLSDMLKHIIEPINTRTLKAYKEIKSEWNTEIKTWRDVTYITITWNKYQGYKHSMTDKQFETYWNLSQYVFLNHHEKVQHKYFPELYDYARAYHLRLIDRDTLMWRVFHTDAINTLSEKPKPNQYDILAEFDFLQEMLDQARDRILEIELIRGDSSTVVSRHAQSINRLYGINNFVLLLKALGKDTIHCGYIYSYGNHEYNKKEILSTLLKRCYPCKTEEQETFNEKVKEAQITDMRLCEAATYSPQWLPFVSKYLDWDEMESAVWWLHAHTNGYNDVQTVSEISKYSALQIVDFNDGAVDVNWFNSTYKVLGKAKWKKLYDSAKYISDGNGHKRAMLYADVILKNTKITEITERINKSRNQDYLRVYGLVPLSKANPDKDVLKRYQFLQKFKKESKQFGAQRQASEGTAVRIALENLARTAGYPDPIRLQWAMESKEAQEIVNNAGDVKVDDCLIQLVIDSHGKSSVIAFKNEKKLKAIPAKLRKHKQVIELKAYNKTLREQYRRTRKSLEQAMINGDQFSRSEIENLMTHPVVSPMLQKLVLTDNNHFGFWQDGNLVSFDEQVQGSDGDICIAHCTDLYHSKVWSDYQKYFFSNKVVQPFKQVFRELYVPTPDELDEQSVSRRYAGHQIQPRKAVALLKGQQWSVDYEEGLQKVHHKQNCIARMFAMADWFSPADVEAPTIETVEFIDREKNERIPFEKLDSRLFSETMRDIDLVVSVAHVGETDPEASQSSIELRKVIVEETCRLFKLKNVSLSDNHAKVKGELGDYSVHLGSGICHKVAGSALSIIPVHSQQRGRLFLPFMDEDPKTAEIMSKVLLLAKDQTIKDPTILTQIS